MTCYLAKADHGLLMPKREQLELGEEADVLLGFAPLAETPSVTLSREGNARLVGDREHAAPGAFEFAG